MERVNCRLGSPSWTPILLSSSPPSQEQLAAFYRDADVALVTPLRDGMNLTGKEFVACRFSFVVMKVDELVGVMVDALAKEMI